MSIDDRIFRHGVDHDEDGGPHAGHGTAEGRHGSGDWKSRPAGPDGEDGRHRQHGGHGDHAQMFRRRVWWSVLLSLPSW